MGRSACREGTETEIELGFEKKFDKEKNLVSESKSFWKEIESDVQIKFDLILCKQCHYKSVGD